MANPPEGGAPPAWEAVKERVADALERDGDERAAYLARVAEEEPELIALVSELVDAAEGERGDALDSSELPFAAGRPDWTGLSVGGYRVDRFLARGGMGEVYAATAADTGRRVALKILARDSDQDRSRFRREGRLLGQLEHPAIAQVIETDVHRSADGSRWPYLALELVDGLPLIAHAEQLGLDRPARLELFVEVCRGVEHAHRKGVVHRDLKPDNILVAPSEDAGDTGPGRPKILDFGIAALLSDDDERTRLTREGDVVGTLAYMAPEQVDSGGGEIDARTDVHALGTILFQLLTGCLPFELAGTSFAESLRVIRDELAPHPSRFDRGLRGDLDTIVGTALAKEPARRYASAAELATDVERHLRHVPIAARPASVWYRAGKFARRHRGLVSATGLTISLLLLGLYGTFRGLREARAESRHVRDVNAFFAEILSSPSPFELGRDVRFLRVLTYYAPHIDARFADHPETAAELHTSVGWALFKLGDLPAALSHLGRAVSLYEAALGPDDERTLMAAQRENHVRLEAAPDDADAHARTEALYVRAVRSLGSISEAARALDGDVAWALVQRGDFDAGVERYRDCLARVDDAAPQERFELRVPYLEGLATALNIAGRPDEALAIQDELDGLYRDRFGASGPQTLMNVVNRAVTLSEVGRHEESLAVLEANRDRLRETLGARHPDFLSAEMNRASAMIELARYEEAADLHQEVVRGFRETLGPGHPETVLAIHNLTAALVADGRNEEAEPWLESLLSLSESLDADAMEYRLSGLALLSYIRSDRGDHEGALELTREVVAGYSETYGPDHPRTLIERNNEAYALHQLDRPDEAAHVYEELVATWRAEMPDDRGTERTLLWNLGRALHDAGRYEDAERTLLEVEAMREGLEYTRPPLEEWRGRMVALYEEWGRPDFADPYR